MEYSCVHKISTRNPSNMVHGPTGSRHPRLKITVVNCYASAYTMYMSKISSLSDETKPKYFFNQQSYTRVYLCWRYLLISRCTKNKIRKNSCSSALYRRHVMSWAKPL